MINLEIPEKKTFKTIAVEVISSCIVVDVYFLTLVLPKYVEEKGSESYFKFVALRQLASHG